MTRHVHVAGPLAPFTVLVRLIEENNVGAIPIVDHQGVPIGIVSEADLLLKARRHEPSKAESMVASEVMTSPAVTIRADLRLSLAAQVMRTNNVGRLVVVDERGRIAGIISRSNLPPA